MFLHLLYSSLDQTSQVGLMRRFLMHGLILLVVDGIVHSPRHFTQVADELLTLLRHANARGLGQDFLQLHIVHCHVVGGG